MKTLLSSILPLLMAGSLSGATLTGVQWGVADLVSATSAATLTNNASSGNFYTWHSTGTALSSGITGYSSQPIYGILQNETQGGAQDFQIVSLYHNAASGDYFSVRGTPYNSENGVSRSISGLVYIQKADFLNGLDSAGPLSFSSSSVLSVDIQQLNSGGTRIARMAILNDGVWYLSQNYASAVSIFTVNDPASTTWAVWDPSGTPLASVPSSFTVAGSGLTNIEAFGIYFYNSQPSTSANQPQFGIRQMQASFEAIPEPGSMALMLGGGALAVFALRRKSGALI